MDTLRSKRHWFRDSQQRFGGQRGKLSRQSFRAKSDSCRTPHLCVRQRSGDARRRASLTSWSCRASRLNFKWELPAGYEVTGVTADNLDSAETQSGVMTLKVNAPSQRSHEFLYPRWSDRSNDAKADTPFLRFKGAQRETGEALVEGAGTMEITAKEGGGLKRMDVTGSKSVDLRLRWRTPLRKRRFAITASRMRIQRWHSDWVRFPDGSVLAARAESAVVTTLVDIEGKSLTEVKLILKNQAQPFLKEGPGWVQSFCRPMSPVNR